MTGPSSGCRLVLRLLLRLPRPRLSDALVDVRGEFGEVGIGEALVEARDAGARDVTLDLGAGEFDDLVVGVVDVEKPGGEFGFLVGGQRVDRCDAARAAAVGGVELEDGFHGGGFCLVGLVFGVSVNVVFGFRLFQTRS